MAMSRSTAFQALLMVGLFVALPLLGSVPTHDAPSLEPEERGQDHIVASQQNFATNLGFTHDNLTVDSVTGQTVLDRPPITWAGPNGTGISNPRAGACAAYLPSTNQVHYIGGRADPDPSQSGDEASTGMVEIYDVGTNTWTPSAESLKQAQQYIKCAVLGEKIYVVGDHHPFSSPSQPATGIVQVYDSTAGNWSFGTSMPGNRSVGLAGVAAHDEMIYVAGGVTASDRSDPTNRLLRYDPVNDSWTQLADMNHERHSFELVSFRGQLIAYGGVTVYFDPVVNTTVQQESNLTEAYNPLTNTWTQLPNATHRFSAYASTVYNDEIIIHGGYEASGWFGSANDKTYGYNPFTNQWNTHATLPRGLYDSTVVRANETLLYVGGDSSNIRFGNWGLRYVTDTEHHLNPESHAGLLTSPIVDLRSDAEGSGSLIWLDFAAQQPVGSFIGLQYRTAPAQQGIAGAPWLPTTLPVNTYLPPGNASMMSVGENEPFVQYRIAYRTDNLMQWKTPVPLGVTLGTDTASFASPPPTTMQPTSSPITISTRHHAPTQGGTYTVALHPANAEGVLLSNGKWMELTWNTTTQQLSIDDPEGVLFNHHATATEAPMAENGQVVNWSFSLSESVNADFFKLKTSTHAQRNASHLHSGLVSVDRNVLVELVQIEADYSTSGDSTVETNELLPGGTNLNISVDHTFANSGLRLLGGVIQSRIHMDLQTFTLDATEARIWENTTSAWFDLTNGGVHVEPLALPENLSGEMHVSLEARTGEDWSLQWSNEPLVFTINGEGPTLLSTAPGLDSYIDEESNRSVSFEFHDVGGFSNETLQTYVWVEAVNDGTNGQPLDGISQLQEYEERPFFTENDEQRWFVNVSVNDTSNANLQTARVLLVGTDVAGYAVPFATPEDGHARWTSRTPSKGELVFFEPTTNLLTPTMLRLEPSQAVGWKLQVVDANGLGDLREVRIELGNDEQLGLRYTTVDNTCEAIDGRLVIEQSACIVEENNGVLELDMTAEVDWSFTSQGIVQGELDVIIIDYDGTTRYAYADAWVLERELSIEIQSVRDTDGEVQQDIVAGSMMMAGDGLNITATVAHRLSSEPYTGPLQLRWNGLLQGEPWRGGAQVAINNGSLVHTIPTPLLSGLMQEVTLTLWDPSDSELLSEVELEPFKLDHKPPEIIPSAIDGTISRYDLDAVEIGVNLDEEQGWSGPLALTCQVRSLEVRWDAVQLVRNSTTVFDGKTMFSFVFDFSRMGDPSTLAEQANLMCWAEGRDDAGWELVSSIGNSELDPWLETSLNSIGPDLALESVEVSQDVEAGEKVRVAFLVTNEGETIDTPFNATIEVVQGDERTLVGRSIIYSIDGNTAKSVKRSFEAPAGRWTLEITVDLEQQIWEIDETNNVHTVDFDADSGGFGSATLLMGGGGVLALIGAGVLLRRRSTPPVNSEALVEALQTASPSMPVEAEVTPTLPPKKRGPPGGKIASTTTNQTKRPPPRGPPRPNPRETPSSPQAVAAQFFDALGSPDSNTAAETNEQTVEDYTQLPGGGDYEYLPEGTFYTGEQCGRWRLNEDKSFTKVSDTESHLP